MEVIDSALRVAFWGLLLCACARLAARALGSRLTGLAHVAWDGACGLVALISLFLFVGMIPGGFGAGVVRSLAGIVIVIGAVAAWSDPLARFRKTSHNEPGDRGVLPLLLVVAIAGLLCDRIPPVFFDARAYHFASPELWLITGRVVPFRWSLHSWFPPGMSILYGVGLATGGDAWANDANLVVGLLLIAMAADLARRLFGPGSGWLAGALTISTPLILYAVAIPGADLAHGLFAFGALGSLLLRAPDHPCWIKRAGILAAGAVLTKYLGLIVPLALGATWLFAWPSRAEVDRSPRARLGRTLGFATPAAVLILPWLAANAIVVGNPIAPTASAVFSTRGLAPGAASSFRSDARGGLPRVDDLLRLPARWLLGGGHESRFYPAPAWGFIPFAFVALALTSIRRDRALRAVCVLAFVLLGVWFVTFRWERFLVTAAALVAVAGAGGIVAAQRKAPRWRLLTWVAATAAVVSILPSATGALRFTGGARVALGYESASEFIETALPSVRLFHRANALLDPARDVVLMVGEMRHYGLSVPRCAPTGFNLHPLVTALAAASSPDQAVRDLRAKGFTHVIVDPGWIARSAGQYPSLAYFKDHPEALSSFLTSLGAPLAVEGQIALYKLPD